MGDGVATEYSLIYYQQGAGINYKWMDEIWEDCQAVAIEDAPLRQMSPFLIYLEHTRWYIEAQLVPQ